MSRRDRSRPPSRRPEVGWDPPVRAGGSARGRRDGPVVASPPDWRLFAALLPLRFFVGATFLYAGIDKLIDPRFLTASGPGSIGEQLTAFTRASPLAGLVSVFALPFPVLIGVLMALVEIAIGLGALTGLLYRVSAAAGAAVSLLFFLTASWTVHPYYYGPDLPYAAGWLTLALAGHGGLAVLRVPFPAVLAPYGDPAEASPERRALLKGGLLAAAHTRNARDSNGCGGEQPALEERPALRGRLGGISVRGEHRRERNAEDRQPAVAGQGQRQPAGRIGKVGPVVVGMDGPRSSQEEEERDRRPCGRAHAVEQPGQCPEADRDLRERHQDTDEDREGQGKDGNEACQRARASEGGQLLPDRSRTRGGQEARIGELVDAGVEERRAHEESERQQRGEQAPVRP